MVTKKLLSVGLPVLLKLAVMATSYMPWQTVPERTKPVLQLKQVLGVFMQVAQLDVHCRQVTKVWLEAEAVLDVLVLVTKVEACWAT